MSARLTPRTLWRRALAISPDGESPARVRLSIAKQTVATWSRAPMEKSLELKFPATEEEGEAEVQQEVAAYCERLSPIKYPATLEILDAAGGTRGSITFDVMGRGDNGGGNEVQALMATLSQHVNMIVDSTSKLVALQSAQLERVQAYNASLMEAHLKAYANRADAHEALVSSQTKILDVLQAERMRRADAELEARAAQGDKEPGIVEQVVSVVPAELWEQLPAAFSLFLDFLKNSKAAGPVPAALSTAAEAAKVLAQ